MKSLLKVEELAMFLLSIYLFSMLDYAWWVFLLLILTPDIGMLGYLINPRLGAITYNIFHHKGLAIVILVFGWIAISEEMVLAGIILFGHASMDRIFGYGLKFSDNFKHTHLGNL